MCVRIPLLMSALLLMVGGNSHLAEAQGKRFPGNNSSGITRPGTTRFPVREPGIENLTIE